MRGYPGLHGLAWVLDILDEKAMLLDCDELHSLVQVLDIVDGQATPRVVMIFSVSQI